MSLGVGIGERIGDEEEQQRRALENVMANARMAMPGEIVDFDAEKQTAAVQPLIKERVNGKWELLPQLLDVPCFFPRAGGHCLTFPVKAKDECLIIFNDMCIDAWWQSSGEQNQIEMRRHDLSDAMALLGITSVPRAVNEYSTDSVMLRNEDKDAYFEIKDGKVINIKSVEDINIETSKNVNIKAAQNINVEASVCINITAKSDINIKADTNLGVNVTGNTTIRSTGDMLFESDGNMKLRAMRVDIKELGEKGAASDSDNVNVGD